MTRPLLEVVREMLAQSKLKPKDIAERAGVKYAWLMLLRNNEIPNPGVVGIQKLYDFFTSAK